MATTFDVNRIGGGTFELVQDPTTGRYTIKEVGFTPVKKLTIPDYTTATTTAGTTDTSKVVAINYSLLRLFASFRLSICRTKASFPWHRYTASSDVATSSSRYICC